MTSAGSLGSLPIALLVMTVSFGMLFGACQSPQALSSVDKNAIATEVAGQVQATVAAIRAEESKPTVAPSATAIAATAKPVAVSQPPTPPSTPTRPPAPTPTTPPARTATPAAKPPQVYAVGQVIPIGTFTLTVLSAKREANSLMAAVQFNNTGTNEVAIQSIPYWDAQTVDGRRFFPKTDTSAGALPLQSKLLPGDKLTGNLRFDIPADVAGLKLYYRLDSQGETVVVIPLDDQAAKEPFPRPKEAESSKPFAAGTVYGKGDAVNVNGVIAKLVTARMLSPSEVTASLVIYNGSSRNLPISNSDSSVYVKDAEGVQGKAKRFGWPMWFTMVPSDTLSGDFQWEFPTPANKVKVYFSLNHLSQTSETIVWSVE